MRDANVGRGLAGRHVEFLAVGGTIGALITGFLADAGMNPNLNTNLKDLVGNGLWVEQLKAMGLTIALAVVATAVIGYALKATIGLRPNEEDEELGLDLADHGEQGYHTNEHTYGHLEQEDRGTPAAASSAAVGTT